MAQHAHHAPAGHFDETDPHHDPGSGHHGHHITAAITLKVILGILLVLTALTVGAANGEQWAAATFDVILPHWVNVAVALSIAVVKAILVLLFFMHLKDDNPINAIIFCFCVFAMGLFMFFTLLDIGSRGVIDPTKVNQVVKGGTVAGGKPQTLAAAEAFEAKLKEKYGETEWQKKYKEIKADVKGHGHGHHDADASPVADRTIHHAGRGRTEGLFEKDTPHADDHAAPAKDAH